MSSFIGHVVASLKSKHQSLEDLIFVLPSKRAGTFLRKAISQNLEHPLFSPKIYSIEEFVEKISGIGYTTTTEITFQLYECYKQIPLDHHDSFSQYINWAGMLLQDFNEMDRHLIAPDELFTNLHDIHTLAQWNPSKKSSTTLGSNDTFWQILPELYHSLTRKLLQQHQGYQGLVYRLAADKVSTYVDTHDAHHIFIGFNALNQAEKKILETLLVRNKADVYWDLDHYFFNDRIHDAGFFIREHFTTWKPFKGKIPDGLSHHYPTEKEINIIGLPKNISQAIYVRKILTGMAAETSTCLGSTALILADESLLGPITAVLPEEVGPVNITMGKSLAKIPLATFFDQFLTLHIKQSEKGWYHQNINAFLLQPHTQKLLGDSTIGKITKAMALQNKAYITSGFIRSIIDTAPIQILFPDKKMDPQQWVQHCIKAILLLKEQSSEDGDVLENDFLYRFYTLFDQLSGLLSERGYVTDLKALKSLYHELLRTETVDFKGNPLDGLQVMGMLESRNLDFENIILTSVNEGILPSGKSTNSFIPYDVKRAHGLPTYKEKDAVYTYHFYRLLQRAKRVFLLYNTEPDVLEGGEKSRLISQLLAERLPGHTIHETIAAPKMRLHPKNPFVLPKDSLLLSTIKNQASKGFSPSSLANYIKNPLLFYKQNLLKVNEVEEVEETMAANTFGTVVHDALETLYKPFLKKQLTAAAIHQMKPLVKEVVAHHYGQVYGGPAKGKNLIAKHVMERYIGRFLSLEENMAQEHSIRILGLEENLSIPLNIPNIPFPIVLKGKLDRVDIVDGQLRIIDYKTGKVEPKHVSVREWDTMFSDYASNKAFQLLCYSLMYSRQKKIQQMQAGIISFKNLSAGLLPFGLKENGNTTDCSINTALLNRFEAHLIDLVAEICNPNVPFPEKEPLF